MAISDTEGADVTNFIQEGDTPDSYDSEAGNFVRVNAAENAVEFFDPFPTNENADGEPVLTVLNGMRIRRFEDDGIVFATFVFNPATFSYDPTVSDDDDDFNVIPWDAELDEIDFATTNNADFTEEFINRVVIRVSDETQEVLDETINAYQLNVVETVDSGDLNGARNDIRTGQYNGLAGGERTVTVTVTTNTGRTNDYISTYSWGAGGFTGGSSTSFTTLPFDQIERSYTIRSTIHPTSNIGNIGSETAVTNDAASGAFSSAGLTNSANTVSNFIGAEIYHDTTYSGTVTATFTRPEDLVPASQTDTERTLVDDDNFSFNPSIRYRTWVITSTGMDAFAESDLGTLDDDGYALDSTRDNDSSTGSWTGRSYQFDNSANTASALGFIVAPSSIDTDVGPDARFRDPDSLDAPIAGITRTPVMLGHADHQVQYYVYTFTLTAGAILNVDVS